MSQLGQHSSSALTRISKIAVAPFDAIRPAKVAVVEVREKDLKKLPSGHELARAYQEESQRGFWIFNGSSNLPEPALPEIQSDLSLGLLPPTSP